MNMKMKIARMGLKIKKYSPEILLAAGVTGVVASTVLACKATTKVEKIKEKRDEILNDISIIEEDIKNGSTIDYTEEDKKNDIKIANVKYTAGLIKLYAAPAALLMASLGCILVSHHIEKKRLIAVGAAYASLDTAYRQYRKNIIEKFGEDVDKEIAHGSKIEKIKENGVENKVEIVEKNPLEVISPYAKFFDAGSRNFEKDPNYNLMYLRQTQNWCNELLKNRGHLFLNEVYDALDIPRTKEGAVVGWLYKPDNDRGDNYVDFGIYNNDSEAARRFVNGQEYNILLDFNVDGVIYDKI